MSDVESLVQQLFSIRADERAVAAEQLCHQVELGSAAAALVDACKDEEEQVRQWAVEGLENLETPDPTIVPLLSERLASDNQLVAYWSATLLGRLGPAASAAADPLGKLLDKKSASDSTRERAAWALQQLGPAATAAIDALKHAARSQNRRLSRLANEALRCLG